MTDMGVFGSHCELGIGGTHRHLMAESLTSINLLLRLYSIFASFNDTFVHVTDLSGRETIVRVTGKYTFGFQPHSTWVG